MKYNITLLLPGRPFEKFYADKHMFCEIERKQSNRLKKRIIASKVFILIYM